MSRRRIVGNLAGEVKAISIATLCDNSSELPQLIWIKCKTVLALQMNTNALGFITKNYFYQRRSR